MVSLPWLLLREKGVNTFSLDFFFFQKQPLVAAVVLI